MIGKSYLINLNDRPDRLASAMDELKRVGVVPDRFEAHTGPVPYLAFNSSQYHCLKKAIADGYAYFTIYEDDVRFSNYGHATAALEQLPMDFDILQLGCNLVGSDILEFQKPERYSENLFTLYDAWQSHSICYSRKCAEWIVEHWDYQNGYIYDEWLRQHVYRHFKCFVIAPQITYQATGKSDIWGGHTDYTGCFEHGNKLLL